jgi:predicted flap endonuclease-1-like 5' DNA nuclease
MLNPAHILEIALLLLVAFLFGAVVGSLARLAISRLTSAKAAAPSPVVTSAVAADAPAVEAAPALVAAPVIGEVVKTPRPTAPADVPAPDFTEALLALAGDKPGSIASKIRMPSLEPLPTVAVTKPADEMRPARVAGETTSGRVVAHPRTASEPARAIPLAGAGAEVIPFPLEKVATEVQEQPAVVAVATSEPEAEFAALIVAMAEQAEPEPKIEPEAGTAVAVEKQPEAPVEVEAAAPVETVSEAVELVADVPLVASAPDAPPVAEAPLEPQPAEVETAAQPDALTASPPKVAVPAAEHSTEDDEGAAMRAIEGNWSPRRSASPRTRKAALPEVAAEAAIAASAAAVASAAQAANQATAAEPEAPGKPVGIPGPRLGVKDDLTHVIGILPIIETALNNLGLYHFDQIAELADENAGWIENHLGIAGRIGREHWREQARELALAMAGTKKAAGQQ